MTEWTALYNLIGIYLGSSWIWFVVILLSSFTLIGMGCFLSARDKRLFPAHALSIIGLLMLTIIIVSVSWNAYTHLMEQGARARATIISIVPYLFLATSLAGLFAFGTEVIKEDKEEKK